MENSSPLNSCIWKSVVLSVLITVEIRSMPRRTAHSRDTRGALRSKLAEPELDFTPMQVNVQGGFEQDAECDFNLRLDFNA